MFINTIVGGHANATLQLSTDRHKMKNHNNNIY